MKNKETYYNALTENNGRLNEIDLGEKLGFDEKETREIIAQLLFEYKIEYLAHGACDYSLMKTAKRKHKKETQYQ
ncbi:hypothetical protein ATO12_00255 [Aquimarina atlantica]|uniref:Uncharacterized protein n=1 Tax=Aquimarina atlantica TaxID=1317122 RepID=A0A023BYS8_9FLAO|nr:hypothetical protein [Aquimarina atlantica]EZH75242.1 hypothetical protein ATO12_00255 [Aquimarina atlantica]